MPTPLQTLSAGLLSAACLGALCGCPSPDEARIAVVTRPSSPAQPRMRAIEAPKTYDLETYRAALKRCLPGDDLLEDLYYGWMLEPYRRATLAVALKAVTVLQRELELRQRGAGNFSNVETVQMLAWLDRAFAESPTQPPAEFSPQRFDARAAVGESGGGTVVGPLFAVVDRASFSRHDHRLGDFDLLVGAGFRAYATGAALPRQEAAKQILHARAAALGIPVFEILAPSSGLRDEIPESTGAIHPVTLLDILAGAPAVHALSAVTDPAAGESWVAMRARRSLLRGATGAMPMAIGCLPLPGPDHESARRMYAAMWVQALDGQQLGLIEGWRDRRDGSRTPYGSLFGDPACLEAAAHASLDLLRCRDVVERCATTPRVLLLLNQSHLHQENPNAWSGAFLELLGELHALRLRFDLAPQRLLDQPAAARTAFDAAVVLPDFGGAGPAPGSALRFVHRVPPAEFRETRADAPGSMAALAATIAEGVLALEAGAGRAVGIAMSDEDAPAPVLCWPAADGSAIAVVNTDDAEHRVTWRAADGGNLKGWQDLLTGRRVSSDLTLEPYQVCLLTP